MISCAGKESGKAGAEGGAEGSGEPFVKMLTSY